MANSKCKTPLQDLAVRSHDNSVAHGFWEGDRNFGEAIALMHSELSEALEEHRSGKAAVYFHHSDSCPFSARGAFLGQMSDPGAECSCPSGGPKPEGIAIELADVVIRVMDWFGHMAKKGDLDGMTVDELFTLKAEFNKGREARHGRAY